MEHLLVLEYLLYTIRNANIKQRGLAVKWYISI